MLSTRPQWSVTGAVPEQSLLSQMLVMSWPQWPAWKPVPGGSWSALKRKVVLGFSGCPPCAADVAFYSSNEAKIFSRRAMMAPLTGVAWAARFWG